MSDLIDREKAINAVYHHFPHISMKDATMVLHEVPTAEERKKGGWLIHDESANAYERRCCGLAWCLFDGAPIDNNMFYCPKCGADMRGEEE